VTRPVPATTTARARDDRLLVLGYHNVAPTWRWPDATVRGFARQMTLLARATNVVGLEQALGDLRAGRPLPPRAVALTFDDGYRDNLLGAVPVLRRLGLPATVFLVPGFLSHKVHAWWERLSWALRNARADAVECDATLLPLTGTQDRARALDVLEASLKRDDLEVRHERLERFVEALSPEGELQPGELFLDWDEARELVRAGIAVGSHTMDHAILARESATAQHQDLRESRELLERELGVAVSTLAYPNGQAGDYDAVTVEAARAGGYSYAVTTRGRVSTAATAPYEISRWVVSPERPAARLVVGAVRSLLSS